LRNQNFLLKKRKRKLCKKKYKIGKAQIAQLLSKINKAQVQIEEKWIKRKWVTFLNENLQEFTVLRISVFVTVGEGRGPFP